MFFVLLSIVSKTFYFRNGMISKVCQIATVRLSFIFLGLYMIFFAIERIIRGQILKDRLPHSKSNCKNEIEYNKSPLSIVLLILRYFFAFLFYIFAINCAFELGNSKYYRRNII